MTPSPRFEAPLRAGAIAASALLAFLSFPNPLVPAGLGFFAWIALAPVLAAAYGARAGTRLAVGFLFGALSRAAAGHWLAAFHPLALAFVTLLSAIHCALLFLLAGAFPGSAGKARPLVWTIVWCCFELARAYGPGDAYGDLSYALYRAPGALRLASAGGVPALGFVLVLVNALIADVLVRFSRRAGRDARRNDPDNGSAVWKSVLASRMAGRVARDLAPAAAIVFAVWALGMLPLETPSGSVATVALVQPNVRHPQAGIADYRRATDTLVALSREALASKPDLVVWHETALVPPLEWHLERKPNPDTFALAADVDGFLRTFPVPVLFGNGTAFADSEGGRRDRNSAKLYLGGRNAGRYDKIGLVPFAERVPFRERWPAFARAVEGALGTPWEPGTDRTVFSLPLAGARTLGFAAPICFEDSLPALFEEFDGAEFFVVLTDDSWSRSEACEYQHLAMSCFRAAETGKPVLRAANSGITARIDASGRILETLPPFVTGVLVGAVPPAFGARPFLRALRAASIWLAPIMLALLILRGAARNALRKARKSPQSGPGRERRTGNG